MKDKDKKQGRGVFYTRDSSGRSEATPIQYVSWARAEAEKLGVSFASAPDEIDAMIRSGQSHRGDLYLDYEVSGHEFARPGLDALLVAIARDKSITHVFIPRRDRLSRPNNPADAVQLELRLRTSGIDLVFMERTCPAIPKGQPLDIAEMIVGIVDYYKAGADRRELAQKLISAQITLAQNGFSIGGRAPFGFDRWLVKMDGSPVRRLQDKERVRQPGHHTAWMPATDGRFDLAIRIREMLKTMPASRVASQLTREGIPSPDAGRTRKDGGIVHQVSGVWHQTTVVNIGRNLLFTALAVAGRRSMGDQLRFTPAGPRALNDSDFRKDDKPKVVSNPTSRQIVAPAHFAVPVERAEHDELIKILDARATSQRGKPRARDPDMNPLGGMIFDLNCTWLMYRSKHKDSFRYSCGAYMQSHGAKCTHNHVDGPTAARFALECLQQKLVSPRILAKLKARIQELAEREMAGSCTADVLKAKRTELLQTGAAITKAERNLALAETEKHHRAVAKVLDELEAKKSALEVEIQAMTDRAQPLDAEAEIRSAMAGLDRLPDLVGNTENLAAIGDAIRMANVRLFLAFKPVRIKKRLLNKLSHGVVTFGSAPPPVPIYEGATSRRSQNIDPAAAVAADSGEQENALPNRICDGGEGNSLGNVSRGDRIRTCDLLVPNQTR